MPPSIVLAFIRVRKATATLILAIALVLLFAQIGGRAQTAEPLSYGGGILVTGDYAVGTLDLTSQQNPPDSTGLATGTIHMAGIPPDADILSADLYWEAITFTASPQQATATFRGHSIDINDAVAVKKSHQDLVGNAASCWTSGQPVTMWRFRADVLRFLPIRLDKNNQPTTKHLVNDADLTANGQL